MNFLSWENEYMARKIALAIFALIALAFCATFIMNNRRDLGCMVYVQSGDIYVKRLPDGQPLRLTQDGLNSTPRFSPSGKWLAFRKSGGELWVTKSNGESPHLIHSGKIRHFKWAPDTDLLAFIVKGELRIALSSRLYNFATFVTIKAATK